MSSKRFVELFGITNLRRCMMNPTYRQGADTKRCAILRKEWKVCQCPYRHTKLKHLWYRSTREREMNVIFQWEYRQTNAKQFWYRHSADKPRPYGNNSVTFSNKSIWFRRIDTITWWWSTRIETCSDNKNYIYYICIVNLIYCCVDG
jgi:hypothetical protein